MKLATVINNSGIEQNSNDFYTYYIQIAKDGWVYYKFGCATGTLKKRFGEEPPEVQIFIIKLWVHTTKNKMLDHESSLFRKYKGDRPFIGRAGPLLFARGNTEVYSHDVMGGEPPPPTYSARLFDDEGELWWQETTVDLKWPCSIPNLYQAHNPLREFEHLVGEVAYMDNTIYPDCGSDFPLIQVPMKSTPERVVIVSKLFLAKIIMKETQATSQRLIGMKAAEDAIRRDIVVSDYSDYILFDFVK